MLVVIDEFSRECLAILVARRVRSDDVLALLTELFVVHGPPDHIRSDNGPEFCVHAVRDGLHGSMSARCSLSLAVLGRTVTVSPSTASSAMNC